MMKEVSKIEPTIGADPELFLVNIKEKFISSVGKFGGSKKHPKAIGNECFIQEDNVAVEFNIAPATTVDKFVASIDYALKDLTKRAADKGLFLSITASKSFDLDQLETPAAMRFGCEPDFNVWTMKQNDSPKSDDPLLRSCGGHIHIGIPDVNRIQLGRWCDVTMGLHSVLEDPDLRRRELYGKAGSIRIKPYGIEYRTPSNYWLQSQDLMKKVFERAQLAVERTTSMQWILSDDDGKEIQTAINNSNKAEAERLIGAYGVG